MTFIPRQDVPLAPLTTLELGGPARHFVDAPDDATVSQALAWADARGLPVFVLGAGSNLVVPDDGYPGLVIRMTARGMNFHPGASPGEALCDVAAGEPWDAVVHAAVARGWAGLECLSGIPGTAGATPVQNVGAYGQEVAETIHHVRVYDRHLRAIATLAPAACGFAYRDSVFKRNPDRFVVLSVGFALVPDGPPALRYAELRAAFAPGLAPSLAEVRQTVLGLRRRKSMVIDAGDPNRRSVGSFFTNPLLDDGQLAQLATRAVAAGSIAAATDLPRFAAGVGWHKVPAAWLIEQAGFTRGTRRATVGQSSNHALALVHHGGGRSADLLALAREIRAAVAARFGVQLVPEPVVLGRGAGEDPLG